MTDSVAKSPYQGTTLVRFGDAVEVTLGCGCGCDFDADFTWRCGGGTELE